MKLYISVGGNVGAVLPRLRQAGERLAARLGPVRWSPIYRTAPRGAVIDQPEFLNAVLEVIAPDDLQPLAVLAVLQSIESELGRDRARETRGGPRPIDLDLLMIGSARCAEPSLTLPHPRMAERRFVLQPLCDLLGPEFALPHDGRSIRELLSSPEIAAQSVELV